MLIGDLVGYQVKLIGEDRQHDAHGDTGHELEGFGIGRKIFGSSRNAVIIVVVLAEHHEFAADADMKEDLSLQELHANAGAYFDADLRRQLEPGPARFAFQLRNRLDGADRRFVDRFSLVGLHGPEPDHDRLFQVHVSLFALQSLIRIRDDHPDGFLAA